MKTLIPTLCIAMLSFLVSAVAYGQNTPPAERKIRIALAGDSTVTDKDGWGKGFAASFDQRVEVINFAVGGRSSKSFVDEGRWKHVLDAKPDYVLIQFGHNDQKPDPALFTDPQTSYREHMQAYVDSAIAAGIRPILVTSLARRQWEKDGWHQARSTLLPYVEVVKEIASRQNIPLVDLHAISIDRYAALGKDAVDAMSPRIASTQPSAAGAASHHDWPDNTHLNAKGSAYFGKLVAEETERVVPELKSYAASIGAKQVEENTH